MSKLHDFLVEHAKFPFPLLDEDLSLSTTDISTLDVGSLEIEWKAKFAVRDDTLVQRLCDALKKNLGDAPLAERAENSLKGDYAIPVGYGTRFKEKYVGRIVYGPERDGMALSYLSQLAGLYAVCEG
jgi:hypothetical protein